MELNDLQIDFNIDIGQMKARLTPRRYEVLKMVARGWTNPEIANALGVSTETAKAHVEALLSITKCRNRTEMVAYAFRNGILPTEDAA